MEAASRPTSASNFMPAAYYDHHSLLDVEGPI